MTRAWAIAVGLSVVIGVVAIVLARPTRTPQSPEARAIEQLRDASIREPEVAFVRASPGDAQVVCGLVVVRGQKGTTENGAFVSTPQRVIVGRFSNPALQQALDRHCAGMFPAQVQPVPD